jgi:hypothetical protein
MTRKLSDYKLLVFNHLAITGSAGGRQVVLPAVGWSVH